MEFETLSISHFPFEPENRERYPLVQGESWYMIDKQWLNSLSSNIADLSLPDPGPIDNKFLYNEDGSNIRDGLVAGVDYVVIHKHLWDHLVSLCGIVECQDPIKRKVVEDGMTPH